MLPVSIIEKPAFIEFMKVFDPSFNVPTRKTVKISALPVITNNVEKKIKHVLDNCAYINVSVDGWSDATMRCFNGYIAQGIDDNWELHTIIFAFQFVTGMLK